MQDVLNDTYVHACHSLVLRLCHQSEVHGHMLEIRHLPLIRAYSRRSPPLACHACQGPMALLLCPPYLVTPQRYPLRLSLPYDTVLPLAF